MPPRRPATEAILMIRPYLFGIIDNFPIRWLSRNRDRMLRFISLSQASMGWSSVDAPHVAPALLTKMSTLPSLATAKSARPAGDKCGLSAKVERLLQAAHVWFSSVVEQFRCSRLAPTGRGTPPLAARQMTVFPL